MKIVLIGYMGSGKSTVGKQLAATLNYTFSDLDDLIENQENTSIQDIFRKRGEIYFRKIENKVLHAVLSKKKPLVLATGGGTPCYGDNLPYMLSRDDVTTVYLKTSISKLTSRLKPERAQRPLIAHLESEEELTEFIGKHLFERSKYYSKAQIQVDTDFKTVSEVVQEIVLQLF